MKIGTAGAIRAVPANAGFVGQGCSYPFQLDGTTGRLKISFGAALVAEALTSIVSTQPGERIMQPDYGASGASLFEPLDPTRLAVQIEKCIEDHEPRIESIKVDATLGATPDQAEVTVTYTIVGEANERVLTAPYFAGPTYTPPGQ
jgi:phage baseplate assembly protein W